MEIIVAIVTGIFSICVSIFGAIFININNIKLQARKLKEEQYVKYLEAVHNLAEDNKSLQALKEYTLYRDKMFIVANEKVVKAMLKYEEKAVGNRNEEHDTYLTEMIKEIRKDLNIKDKSYPQVFLKKSVK